jgi:hypothetical protein
VIKKANSGIKLLPKGHSFNIFHLSILINESFTPMTQARRREQESKKIVK